MFNYMVESLVDVDEVFHALSHPTRRDMLGRLRASDLTVGSSPRRSPSRWPPRRSTWPSSNGPAWCSGTVQGRTTYAG